MLRLGGSERVFGKSARPKILALGQRGGQGGQPGASLQRLASAGELAIRSVFSVHIPEHWTLVTFMNAPEYSCKGSGGSKTIHSYSLQLFSSAVGEVAVGEAAVGEVAAKVQTYLHSTLCCRSTRARPQT